MTDKNDGKVMNDSKTGFKGTHEGKSPVSPTPKPKGGDADVAKTNR